MNEEEKKAIEQFKYMTENGCEKCIYEDNKTCVNCFDDHREILLNLIEKQQKELEKKDKIIDLMAEVLTDCEFDDKCQECNFECERDYDQLFQCNKEYFTKKADETNG